MKMLNVRNRGSLSLKLIVKPGHREPSLLERRDQPLPQYDNLAEPAGQVVQLTLDSSSIGAQNVAFLNRMVTLTGK